MESAVELIEVQDGIVQIKMQDKKNKNTFSNELVAGLIDAYERVKINPAYKVVILTGYDTYFCCGGTQESLLAMHEGKAKFTDVNLYSLALECPVPVISAMQGHGIGGGFVMGLYSDLVILSRESIYTTNFMKYGFTPGMGATCILPEKLGLPLSGEMMLMADTYRGEELKQRGIPFPVLPRDEVFDKALSMAKMISEKPRESLVTLKQHLNRSLLEKLPGIIKDEVRMHEITFNQPEVKKMISERFIKKI